VAIINWEIIKNPLNWLIVALMLIIAGFAFDVVVSAIHPDHPAQADSDE